MLTSSKKIKKLFLTNNTKVKESDVLFNIIVSPEFYWIRKFEIPVKNVKQALEVLPTMFEDIVQTNTQNLSYQVQKIKENVFLAFAYDTKQIQEALKNANIPFSNVNNLYFAQNECKNINAFAIDEQNYLYTKDAILVKVPVGLVDNSIDLKDSLDAIELSSFKLNMKFYSTLISTKMYYTILIAFALLSLMNFIKYSSYTAEIKSLDTAITQSKQNSGLPASTLQINSIFKNYEKTILDQKKKREAIDYVISNKKLDLKSITVRSNEIELEYLSANKGNAEKFLRKKFKILSSQTVGFSLKVRVEI